jgi:tetratricopeptide (TPR) repeat protein
MKKNCLLLFLLGLSIGLRSEPGNSILLDSGNAAYNKKNFSAAIRFYERVLEQGQESHALYYNLGNAYFKSQNIPKAILNYERAKRATPADEDLKNNLKMANDLIADKVEPAQTHCASEWKNRFLYLLPEKGWSVLSISCFVICLFCAAFFILFQVLWVRQLSFAFCGGFLLVSALCFILARQQYQDSLTHSEAILIAPSINVKGSPDEKGTDLFILHEGTKVSLIQTNGTWEEVRLSNGNVGWIPFKVLETI